MESDEELVQQFQATHDEIYFSQLVNRHSSYAFQIAYGILHNREDSEEVVQDAFIRIHRALPKFRGDSKFSTWMYRIILNLCTNKYHWNKRRNIGRNISLDAPLTGCEDELLHLDPPAPSPTPVQKLELEELHQKLDSAMQTLPESYRVAVLLRNVRQMDYEQIASILGCAVGTIKSRINRGRELLKEALKL